MVSDMYKKQRQMMKYRNAPIVDNPNCPITVTVLSNKSGSDAMEFYKSPEWKACRKEFLEGKTLECACCKEDLSSANRSKLNVDHIKPLRYYWDLRLDHQNLQILCNVCNKIKGNDTGPETVLFEQILQTRANMDSYRLQLQKENDLKIAKAAHKAAVLESNRDAWINEYYNGPRTRKNKRPTLAEFIDSKLQTYLMSESQAAKPFSS